MPKFVQKSFSKGVLSPAVLLNEDIPGYSHSARKMHNLLIGRQGEAYRRSGTNIVSVFDSEPSRAIPFYSDNKSFLICFLPGRITNQSGSSLENSESVFVLDVTSQETPILNSANFNTADFLSKNLVKIYGSDTQDDIGIFEQYGLDVENGLSDSELKAMDYTQIGNLLIFVSESHPPFYIRKEGEDFVLYRSAIDMIVNGNGENIIENKALYTLPYSFYGMGLSDFRIDGTKEDGTFKFEAYLSFQRNYDASGIEDRNLDLWKNRAFIYSTQKRENDDVVVFGGIIRLVDDIQRGGKTSKYRVRGRIKVSNASLLSDIRQEIGNLYLCDWSERAGWPRTVSVFENRICYGANEAYPTKIWFSAQPGVQRVQFGNTEKISPETENRVQTRIVVPQYKEVYFDQLDLFSKETDALGLIAQHTSSAGSVFINDNRGFSIFWLKGLDNVLAIGTDRGLFITQGTDAGSPNPIPFNAGFKLADDVPVKRVFPEIVNKSLFYIINDNSIHELRFGSERGFASIPADSFSKDVVKDNSSLTFIQKTIKNYNYTSQYPAIQRKYPLQGSEGFNLFEDFKTKFVRYDNTNDRKYLYAGYLKTFVEEEDERQYHFSKYGFNAISGSLYSNLEFPSLATPQTKPPPLEEIFMDIWATRIKEKPNALTHYNTDIIISSIAIVTRMRFRTDQNFVTSRISIAFLKRANSTISYDHLYMKQLAEKATDSDSFAFVGDVIDFEVTDDDVEKTVSTLLQGKMPKGGHILLEEGIDGNRLIGAKKESENVLRLYHLRPFFQDTISKIKITEIMGNNERILFNGDIPRINRMRDIKGFGKQDTAKTVYSIDLELNEILNENISDSDIKVEYLSSSDAILGTINFQMENDLDFGIGMRDSLTNKFSGDFGVISYDREIGQVENAREVSIDAYKEIFKELSNFIDLKNYIISTSRAVIPISQPGVPTFTAASSVTKNISGNMRIYYAKNLRNANRNETQINVADRGSVSPNNTDIVGIGSYVDNSRLQIMYNPSNSRFRDFAENGSKVILNDQEYDYMSEETLGISDFHFLDVDQVQTQGLFDTVNEELTFNIKKTNGDLLYSSAQTDGVPLAPEAAIREKITLTEIVETDGDKMLPVFSAKTRMLYDWSQKTLFIIKENGDYLAFCMDEMTKVKGWTTGKMNLSEGVFIRNLKFNPPRQHSALFGIRGNSIIKLPIGMFSRSQEYVENLPPCLDEHIILNVGASVNLTQLKASLLAMGYEMDDKIYIATSDNLVLSNVRIRDLSGTKELERPEPIIVGKPFNFLLVTWPALSGSRKYPSLKGVKHTYSEITIHSIFDTDIQINGNLSIKKEPSIRYKKAQYGSFYYDETVESDMSYDPFLEITAQNPFPWAIGGYILDIKDGVS